MPNYNLPYRLKACGHIRVPTKIRGELSSLARAIQNRAEGDIRVRLAIKALRKPFVREKTA